MKSTFFFKMLIETGKDIFKLFIHSVMLIFVCPGFVYSDGEFTWLVGANGSTDILP